MIEVLLQYIQEVIAIGIFLVVYMISGDFVYTLKVSFLFWIMCHLLFFMADKFLKPQMILHLLKNEICMRTLFQHGKSKTDDYVNEIEFICKYAKFRKMLQIFMQIHFVIASKAVKQYVHNDKKYLNFCKLSKDEELKILSDIGELEITYLGERVNRCARYKYGIIMSPKELYRTFEKRLFYKIVVNFEKQ